MNLRVSPKIPNDEPATTLQISSSVAGLIALCGNRLGRTHCQLFHHAEITHLSVCWESTEGTNSLLMNNPVGSLIVLPVAGIIIFAI